MSLVNELKERIIAGGEISREEALQLFEEPVEDVAQAADEIREKFCGNGFDICTIINGKSGRCSENCKFCAQSAHYNTGCTEVYDLLPTEDILREAKYNDQQGVLRYSIVTSGKRLSDEELDQVCESIRRIKSETDIEVCFSFGLLNEDQLRKVREAGATRAHCNMETSRRYFPEICTTHTYDQKIETLKAAVAAGLSICSGGIMGLGEALEDRVDMVFTVKELGVKSVPVNFLNPIPGTPYENNRPLTEKEARQCVAVFRFIIPDASIRLAGGRGLLSDKGRECFRSGANAAISGDMLTTAGITVQKDMDMLKELGYRPELWED
mgnify:FL=1